MLEVGMQPVSVGHKQNPLHTALELQSIDVGTEALLGLASMSLDRIFFVCLELKLCVFQEDVPKHKGWLQNATQVQKPPGAATKDIMIPLEFKTGKPFNGHNAQVPPTH